ncbi:MAG TPA: ATP-binding protein, partial [Myxococcaceae bacterium]|nr:ATP-binding protein [Myxococcaceae bacterium]
PGIDGLETVRRMWEVDRDLQVVICTAYSDRSWAELSASLGERDNLLILKKPFDNVEVLQLGTALSKKWELQREVAADRKAMQTRLLISDKMAALGTLAGGVAHEINNPLAFVMSNLQFLRDRIPELLPADLEEAREVADVMADTIKGAERIRDIVRGLKTFSRGDEEKRGPVDVGNCLTLSLNITLNELKHRARLVRQCEDRLFIDGNESKLGQVFINLLMNAAQAIPPGHADRNEIRISARRAGAGQVVIEFSDTGSGMAPEVRRRIFEPFFTTKPIGVGTGLGLAICHGIVQSFGGDISVESAPGQGTTFRMVLPEATRSAAAAAVTVSKPAPAVRRGRVLIVDDEPQVASAVSRLLASEHQVDIATTGPEALRSLGPSGAAFDVVLCDLMMPEMNGIELYRRLSARAPASARKFIFMTGGVFTEDERAFIDKVAAPVLLKPVEAGHLREVVRSLLG